MFKKIWKQVVSIWPLFFVLIIIAYGLFLVEATKPALLKNVDVTACEDYKHSHLADIPARCLSYFERCR